MNNYRIIYQSPVGPLHIVSNGKEISGIWFETCYPEIILSYPIIPYRSEFETVIKWLDYYFQGYPQSIDSIPIHLYGTSFQLDVWNILKTIPFGNTVSYKDIANRIAHNRGLRYMSSQAIGQAVGANPISIIIPCHRVIGINGKLTGYAGGLDIKHKLLLHEGIYIEK